jgi:hypothetical protein
LKNKKQAGARDGSKIDIFSQEKHEIFAELIFKLIFGANLSLLCCGH